MHRINPPRGPLSVLWVVDVTTSAYGTGSGWALPATRPAKCAMSTIMIAPTSSQIALIRGKSKVREYAVAPETTIRGRCSRARWARTS